MTYIKSSIKKTLAAGFLTLLALSISITTAFSQSNDQSPFKPFVYAFTSEGDMDATVADVKSKLETAGFTIAGEYSPYAGVTDIAVTSAALQTATAKTDFGNFAAAQRVSITDINGTVQVAYTNPHYMSKAYRLDADLLDIKASLAAALGNEYDYGSKKGLNDKKLAKYRYMGFPMFTERFDDPDLLAEYDSHEEAIAALEAGLSAEGANVSKVYRIDIEGTSDSLYGVAIAEGNGGDMHIMGKIDFEDIRSSAHLPYEVLVKDNEIYALGARFRIAISFPDLKMVGSHSFAGIMSAPGAIKKALKEASGK